MGDGTSRHAPLEHSAVALKQGEPARQGVRRKHPHHAQWTPGRASYPRIIMATPRLCADMLAVAAQLACLGISKIAVKCDLTSTTFIF